MPGFLRKKMTATCKKEFSSVKSAHLIGIKGTAMEALAELFISRGINVTGSDVSDTFYTDALLRDLGIVPSEGFSSDNIPEGVDLIVHSTAYNKDNNPEVAYAVEKNLPLISYPEALGLLFGETTGIAICGTHGKTTTTAMLAEILKKEGLDPAALVGSKVAGWGKSTLSGQGNYFIAEADEYQNKLQHYKPHGVVVTNIDYDHPDFFASSEAYVSVFHDFFQKIPAEGFLVFNIDDPEAKKAARGASCKTISFGEGNADFSLQSRSVTSLGQVFHFTVAGEGSFECMLQLSGSHNAANALAAIAAAFELGVPVESAARHLAEFASSERRFQAMGKTANGALIFDDYAHHPEEIKATLKGARERFPEKKIIVAFHPHTYSRTEALFEEFSQAFGLADMVYILDIYASARENAESAKVHSRDLAERIMANGVDAEYVPTIEQLAPVVAEEINQTSVFISMGAGDVWKIHEMLLKNKAKK